MVEYNILSDIVDYGYEVERANDIFKNAGGDKVLLNIASDGGEVFTGLKIAGLIENYSGETQANIYGLAASIATVIALAADKVYINKYGFFMIHNSWTLAMGNKEELQKQRKTMTAIDDTLANIYVNKIESNGKLIEGDKDKTVEAIKRMMKNETFLNAKQALEMGLVDGMISKEEEKEELESLAFENIQAKATIYNKLPNYFNKTTSNEMDNKKSLFAQFMKFLGLSKDEATEALNALEEAEATEQTKETAPEAEATTENQEPEAATDTEANKVAELETKLEEMQKQLEEKSSELAELQNKIANSAPYTKESKETKKSMFSAELTKQFETAFNNK